MKAHQNLYLQCLSESFFVVTIIQHVEESTCSEPDGFDERILIINHNLRSWFIITTTESEIKPV